MSCAFDGGSINLLHTSDLNILFHLSSRSDSLNRTKSSSRLTSSELRNSASRLNLKASSHKYLITFSPNGFNEDFSATHASSSSRTKKAPRRLSSVEAIPWLLPRMTSLITVLNCLQETEVSRIRVSAYETFVISFRTIFIDHRRWKAESRVKTFWSEVFIVAKSLMFEGIPIRPFGSPVIYAEISGLLTLYLLSPLSALSRSWKTSPKIAAALPRLISSITNTCSSSGFRTAESRSLVNGPGLNSYETFPSSE